ncbi:MAG TPA: tyrosine--tRNA ligase [Actinomycetes bacterium]
MTDILDDLHWRGLIALTTDEQALRTALAAGPVTLYGGFDPTAPSLHIGNLVLILALRRFQLAGHRPLGLVGGATGLIGDPSGKSAERVLNDRDVVAAWVDRARGQIEPFLDFDGPNAARMVNNLDWTAQLSTIDFLRDIGKHFPVNRMVSRESVAARLDAGISYTEFSYQILQAMDFLELHRRFGCRLQAGGSDQWGNLTAGVDLIRRVTGERVHALATPLITKADGTKYGKTEDDAVWLDPEMTSPYAFYQFWFNQADTDVIRLLKVYSFRSQDELEELEKQTAERPAARVAQRALAGELTVLVHGDGELARVEAASRALFGQGDLRDLDERTLAAALAEVPSAEVPLADGALPPVSDLLAQTGLVPSKSAGRRTVAEGGAYINNRKVTDPEETVGAPDLLFGQWVVLRRGKRSVGAVRAVR